MLESGHVMRGSSCLNTLLVLELKVDGKKIRRGRPGRTRTDEITQSMQQKSMVKIVCGQGQLDKDDTLTF